MQGDDPIEPICFAHREFDVMPTVNQFNCARPMAGVIHDTTCHLHGNRDAVNCDLRYGTGQYAVDGQASAVVFRRDRYTLNQEMTIGQGGESQRSHSRDSASSVLMSPLPPENALPHIKNAAMFQIVALAQPKWIAFNRGG